MEALKKERTPLRAVFTKTANQLESLLNEENPDVTEINTILKQLDDKFNRLEEVERRCLENLVQDVAVSEDDYSQEFEISESYRDRLSSCRVKVEAVLQPRSSHEEDDQSSSRLTSASIVKKKFKLPQIELKKFSGEIREWLSFWGQFRKIDCDADIEPEDKLEYLILATEEGSRARRVVESFPRSAENYPKAIAHLKQRFGKDEMLVEVYVRDLLCLVLQKAMNPKANVVISSLYDKLETQLRSLDTLGVTSEKYAAMLYPLVESCLPEDLLRVWERKRGQEGNSLEAEGKNSLSGLMEFLRNEVDGEERILLAKSGFGVEDHRGKLAKKVKENFRGDVPTAAALYSGDQSRKQITDCVFCDKRHLSQDCFRAPKMDLEEKQKLVKEKKVCFVCLKGGHWTKQCKSKIRCPLCSKRHFIIMCPDLVTQSNENKKVEESSSTNTSACTTSLANKSNNKEVLLQTLMVLLRNGNKWQMIRAMIDNGSQRSYITEKAAKLMGYHPIGEERILQTLFGGLESAESIHRVYRISVCSLDKKHEYSFAVLDQPIICGSLPRIKPGELNQKLLKRNIVLSDFGEGTPEIDLLIGADEAGKFWTGVSQRITEDLFAFETYYGWSLMGKVPGQCQRSANATMVVSLLVKELNLTDLWRLDSLGILDPIETQSKDEIQQAAMDHFNKTVQIDTEGRYQVSLPWISGHPELKSNRCLAEQRLKSTTTKLNAMGKFQAYDEIFKNWLIEGIIEKVPEKESFGHYLPHRGVFKPRSTTTKIRPVFDASAKVKSSVSLNDCLAKGPNLLELIPSLLIRFRMKWIGLLADIEKAFLQINITESERDFLRFLWWESEAMEKVIVYRHCRVVFGVTSSPFLLAATLKHIVENSPEHLQATGRKMLQSFYVDNCLIALDDEEEAIKFIKESTVLLSNAKFKLRGWIWNVNSILLNKYVGMENSPFLTKEKSTSLLGYEWDLVEDTFRINTEDFPMKFDGVVTKRKLLSATQKVFDPLGFVSPVTVLPKLLIQKTWEQKIGWDDEISGEIANDFRKWQKELHLLNDVRLPRKLYGEHKGGEAVLHVFSDASTKAYASCAYLRVQNGREISVQLVMSKSRLKPLAKATIPRLELLGCAIAVRLAKNVKEAMELPNIPCHFWSDSMNALSWIRRDDQWGTFVWNRVKEILKYSDRTDWHHVPGELNPADLPSRGCTVKKLLELKWWEGPSWLALPKENWPNAEPEANEEIVMSERRKTIASNVTGALSQKEPSWYANFPTYRQMLMFIAAKNRFCENARIEKKLRKFDSVTVEELNMAEIFIVKCIQEEGLVKNKDVLRQLSATLYDDGIIRLKTKIVMRQDSESFKFPALLPAKHPVVEKLVRDLHLEYSHAGVQVLMSMLREKFWILQARKTIRTVIRSCLRCRRFDATRMETIPAPLPLNRVRDASVFEITGCDLAGPFFLKGRSKVWVVLFTCAVYRAVHFELVSSLSADDFLQSFRRFIARRGRPCTMYSDNGTNFVGAQNSLSKLDWDRIALYAAEKRITWIFNPPAAPWWGGWWERIVRMMKQILRRVLGQTTLCYEDLSTVLCDCESIINSRPLTYVSEDSQDLTPLTPMMFLHDVPQAGVPDLDLLDSNGLNRRTRYLQRLRDDIRKRFRSEYLGQLIQKFKSKDETRAISVGDIVLIGSDNVKRVDWPLGRVLELYPGRDGVERVAKIKTKTGEFLRPLQRLYPLEVSAKEIGELEKVSLSADKRSYITRAGRNVKVPKKYTS